MSSAPYFKLYFSDLAGDTLMLSDAEMGSYILLIGAMWNAGGSLPNDPAKLSRAARVSHKSWPKRWGSLREFFIEDGGYITHKRVSAEAEKVRGLSQKRSDSGILGAESKRLKSLASDKANACFSGKQTGKQTADIPESIVSSEPNGSSLSDANTSSGEQPKRSAKPTADDSIAEELWKLQPVIGGKRRSSRPDVRKALARALRRGGAPPEILAASRVYYALPACREREGQFAQGAAVLLHEDRWRDYLPAGELPLLCGPSDARVSAYRAQHFAETGEWRPEWGARPGLSASASKLAAVS